MRETNFSIPNANKASVGITPALYDRRALDCTSTLPLINSLNNLAYLTTSSARIRDILTVDGGVERLVSILKEGRSKDQMEMWKWNLAFQCVVNIGVRGSENVRTRVVEADMVPVVATILDNYIQAMDKCREKEMSRHPCHSASFSHNNVRRSSRQDPRSTHRTERSRRQAPPPIEIPQAQTTPVQEVRPRNSIFGQLAQSQTQTMSSPPEQTTFARQRQQILNPFQAPQAQDPRPQFTTPLTSPPARTAEQLFDSSPFGNNLNTFGIRPVRDVDRLPSMLVTANPDLSSQPVSPSTPVPTATRSRASMSQGVHRRPSIRHQLSVSGPSWEDEEQNEDEISDNAANSPEPPTNVQDDIVMQDVPDTADALDGSVTPVALALPTVNVADADVFGDGHRSAMDDSRTNGVTPPQTQTGFNPVQPLPPVNVVNATPPSVRQTLDSYYGRLPALPNLLTNLPRDDDVVMALQLLAYVSKYCNLRSFFQSTHLVSRLKVGAELKALDSLGDPNATIGKSQEDLDDEWDNEFVRKPEEPVYNIFPLIEKFTVKSSSSSRHASQSLGPLPQQSESMQYWAGVVMRNLCRKDESRGGIRQCAFWKCGKWEERPREFAKCRRCRRTKYCSKECQKGAWGTHRFWCVAAEESSRESSGHGPEEGPRDGNGNSGSTGRGPPQPDDAAPGQHHHHHHRHHHHNHHHSHGEAFTRREATVVPN